jgi:hypothetical protein
VGTHLRLPATTPRPGPSGPDGETAGTPAAHRPAEHDPGPASPDQPARPPGIAVLLMSRLRPSSVPWALTRLARGAGSLGPVPGLRFARVLGSGRGGGFGLVPGLDCQGVFATFDRIAPAEAFATCSDAARAYRERALEHFFLVLRATSCRGSWAGHAMAPATATGAPPPQAPVVALTRASIRPGRMAEFWRHSPPAEADLAGAPGCRLAVGLGEAPLLRQATVSVWDGVQAMDGYARHGAHQRAIHASWGGGYFSEWMFVRFELLHAQGRWHGADLAFGAAGG